MAARKTEIVADPDAPTITCTRTFDAPRALVFDCFTKPEHQRHWMGPRQLEITVCEGDPRVGGQWRIVHRAPDGTEHPFHGEYLEFVRPERFKTTWFYDPVPFASSVESHTFEERDGRTIVRTLSEYGSPQARDGHLKNGMEAGTVESHERLDELLSSLRGPPTKPVAAQGARDERTGR